MSCAQQKSAWFFRMWLNVLLGITFVTAWPLLGVAQTMTQPESSVLQTGVPQSDVPQTGQSSSQAESAVPPTEQLAPLAESAVPPTEQPAPLAGSSVSPTEQLDHFEAIKSSRDNLSGKITRFANYIDQYFGGDRHYQESNQSVLQLNLTRSTGYGGDGNFKIGARLNLKLPVTEGRLRLLLETDPENNVGDEPTKISPSSNNKISAPGGAAVAVRYEKKEESQLRYNTDAGIKFRGIATAPNPFVRARASYSGSIGEWRSKIAESLFWFNSLGLGETTQLDLERILSASLLFRATSNATWLNDKKNFDLRQDFTFFHTVDDRNVLRYQGSVIGVSNPQLRVTDYVAQVLYRYRLNREWLFFEVSPQLHFPRDRNYHPSPALSVRLEVLFDDSR